MFKQLNKKVMLKRYIILSALTLVALAGMAQETYENANIATQDLNGTARYVAMGGALEALGADISTISTNPAGIGLFRRSTASLSFGFSSQGDADKFHGESPTKMSFDQAGFVIASRAGSNSFVNFAFNYHKSRNFNYILKAANSLDGYSSQNRVSYNKGEAINNFIYSSGGGVYSDDIAYSQVDYLYYNTMLKDEDGNYYYSAADAYTMNRANTGYISEYDLNMSGNYNDRLYWGITVGIYDVHYNGYSEYTENLVAASGADMGDVLLEDYRKITGTGVDVKFGLIFRPVESSPFRIGLSVATPTFYDLKTRNYTKLYVDGSVASDAYLNSTSLDISESYNFKLYTPWKFGVSLGHTVGNYLALGVSYEYADYTNIDSRIDDGDGWDDWGYYYEDSHSDDAMNYHTENTLKGVSTLKIGAEYKPIDNLSVRLGFNYVSPMYEDYGSKDGIIESIGNYYQSATDYTNWDDTYRITAGVGFRMDKFTFDIAYQYSCTDGTFYPFSDVSGIADSDGNSNIATPCSVSNKRHQLLFTLGYTF